LDGYYTFLAERKGLQRRRPGPLRWGVDIEARDAYWKKCAAEGVLPDTNVTPPTSAHDLPGRRGFELASRALHSKSSRRR